MEEIGGGDTDGWEVEVEEQGVSDAFVGGVTGGEGCLYTNDNQMFFL